MRCRPPTNSSSTYTNTTTRTKEKVVPGTYGYLKPNLFYTKIDAEIERGRDTDSTLGFPKRKNRFLWQGRPTITSKLHSMKSFKPQHHLLYVIFFSALAHMLVFFHYWENTYPKKISERTIRDAFIANELIKPYTFG